MEVHPDAGPEEEFLHASLSYYLYRAHHRLCRHDTQAFWTTNKKDDAVKMLKDSIAKVTAVEEAVSAPTPDQQAVLAAFKQVGGTCQACHKQYREQDENMQYRLKAGTI